MVRIRKSGEVEEYQGISRNESGELAEGRWWSRKKLAKSGGWEPRKHKEDEVKSRKVEDGIEKVGRGRQRSGEAAEDGWRDRRMLKNAEADG
jgi:hypothetical protein